MAGTSAQVYRSDLVHEAIRRWPGGLRNLVTQIYWTGFCAANGAAKVTGDTHLECAAGTHFLVGTPRVGYKLDLGDTIELCARLAAIGYPAGRWLRLARRQLAGNKRHLAKRALRWPVTGAGALVRIGIGLASLSLRARAAARSEREEWTAAKAPSSQ